MLVTISKILLIINIAMMLFSTFIGEMSGIFAFGGFATINIITIYMDEIFEDVLQILDRVYKWINR